jgi:hypothetical protein
VPALQESQHSAVEQEEVPLVHTRPLLYVFFLFLPLPQAVPALEHVAGQLDGIQSQFEQEPDAGPDTVPSLHVPEQ